MNTTKLYLTSTSAMLFAFVVFVSTTRQTSAQFHPDTPLSQADASFIGEGLEDGAWVVGMPGDVNGDGLHDFLIGAFRNGEGGGDAGQTYLILGKGLTGG